MKSNIEIRTAIEKRRLRYYEVARALNIHPATFTRILRYELPKERKQEILKAIRSIKV